MTVFVLQASGECAGGFQGVCSILGFKAAFLLTARKTIEEARASSK